MKYFLLILILFFPLFSINGQWVQTNGALGYQIFCLAENGKNLFAGTFGGGVFLSTDDGSNWSSASNNLNGNVYSLAVFGGNDFAGTDNFTYKTTNNGSYWTQIDSGLSSNWSPALYVYGSNLYSAGSGGVYVINNNGSSWTMINDPWGELKSVDIDNIIIVSNSGAGNAYIFVGCKNGIYRSNNNGQSWTALNNGLTDLAINTFAFIPDYSGTGNLNLFVGTNAGGGVFRSTDYGTSWAPVNNGLGITSNMAVYAFAVNGSDLFVSTGGGIFLSKDYGVNWFYVDDGFNATARSLLVTNASKLIAGTLFYGIWSRPLSEMTPVEDFLDKELPKNYYLDQNYPNPFNPNTTIQFDIPKTSFLTLKVYNVLGQEVATLVNEKRETGRYEAEFDGSKLTSGVYFYRLTTETFIDIKKCVIIK